MANNFNRATTLFIALAFVASAIGARALGQESLYQSPRSLFSYSHSYATAGLKGDENDKASKSDYLDAAIGAAKWIRSTIMETPKGRIWPDDALNKEAVKKLKLRQDRMAHASELLQLLSRHKLRYQEVPVTITYSEYSLTKGQSNLDSFKIIVDLIKGSLL